MLSLSTRKTSDLREMAESEDYRSNECPNAIAARAAPITNPLKVPRRGVFMQKPMPQALPTLPFLRKVKTIERFYGLTPFLKWGERPVQRM